MDNFKSQGKLDPDYESYNSALEITKEEDKKENFAKLKKIVEEEYSKELVRREEHIENIEVQIAKVRKLLHLLRYVLVTSYYKKQELEFTSTQDEASTSDSFMAPSKQSRIHPAIKKLLGKNVQSLDYLSMKDKRKSVTRFGTSVKLSEKTASESAEPLVKKIKLEEESVAACERVVQEIKLESIKNRKKTKYRIVIGNISKFMPSSEDDNLTHKWMVYVRGPKEKPDVSHFVDKVVFYLHSSYKPHDVVEVSDPPFHLSRRGWGEFPVRVQIFFKVTINKPIHVVHNIKLDKTYTGRQTLGNETFIDVFLYDHPDSTIIKSEMETPDKLIDSIKEEIMKENELEHNYCHENVKIKEEVCEEISIEEDTSPRDHSYSLPYSQIKQKSPTKKKEERVIQDESNTLIYGLDDYLEQNFKSVKTENNKQLIIKSPVPGLNSFDHILTLNRKDIKLNNTKIIVFGKKIDGLLTNISKLVQIPKNVKNLVLFASKNEQENYKVHLAKHKYKNMGEALAYLFKKLPLYTDLAKNPGYKRLYPFTATTLKEFTSWNIGKRRSSEWSRAKAIRKIALSEKIHGAENWNTKSILMYGRSHSFTPSATYGLFVRDSSEKQLLLSSYSSSDPQTEKFTLKSSSIDDSDITVNVDSDIDIGSPPKRFKSSVDISDPVLRMECSYVKQSALDIGVMLKCEEVENGVVFNGAERMILEAVKCLANNVIRQAENYRICHKKHNERSDGAISREDVNVAINERPEMMALLKFKNKRRNLEYFS